MKRLVFIAVFTLIAGTVFSQAHVEANAAASDALRRLEATLSGNSSNQGSSSPAAQVTRGGSQPRWVDEPYNAYSRDRFIAAVGFAANRNEAEAKAFAALVAVFGQSIRSDFTVATAYSEAVNSGVVRVSQNRNIQDRITTAASMENLIGAEIGNIWDSGKGTVYALAYMDKAKTISIYTDMIVINIVNIETLTVMSPAAKNTFDGYARYRLAAQIAGINANYAAVVTQAGGSVTSLNLRNSNFYNMEAAEIIKNITVAVAVANDRANRVQNAFARTLGAEGFRTRGNNPPYTLEVFLTLSQPRFQGSEYAFCLIEVSANLIENATGASLISFSDSHREGHNSYATAETRAFAGIEEIIAEKFPEILQEYFASLIPK